jgi:hypothetical protein
VTMGIVVDDAGRIAHVCLECGFDEQSPEA